jgi:hypothetical protein
MRNIRDRAEEDAEGWLATQVAFSRFVSFPFVHQSTCAGNNRWSHMHKYFKRVLAVNSILEKDFFRKGKGSANLCLKIFKN